MSSSTLTTITESVPLRCPYETARRYLYEALQGAPEPPLPSLLQLTAEIPLTHIELAKDVQVEYTQRDGATADDPWRVHWQPEPGGVYPAFEGELCVRPQEEGDAAILELQGHYRPPLGAVGRAFDAVLGRKIAMETARKLLDGIAHEMQTRCEREDEIRAANALQITDSREGRS